MAHKYLQRGLGIFGLLLFPLVILVDMFFAITMDNKTTLIESIKVVFKCWKQSYWNKEQ